MTNQKQRGLGRDLESLLGRRPVKNHAEPATEVTATASAPTPMLSAADDTQTLRDLPIDVLQPGRYQPRQTIEPEALEELANSIRTQGVIQPIIVRTIGDKKYEIIAGERRWRAAQLAGLETVPAVIKNINDETASAMALIENVQREDLNPMEEALAYQRLTDEFGLTHQEVADLVGKARVTISNMLRLLQLNHDVRTFLQNGDIEMGHARALLGLSGLSQSDVARTVIAKSLSVRETEKLVRQLSKPAAPKTSENKLDADTRALQQRLSETLGAKVAIEHKPTGDGKLVIHYSSLDELDGILAHIK